MFALRYMGEGEFRAIHPHHADRSLVVGEVHRWQIASDDARSSKSHRHYFASIAEAWKNLPEHLVDDLPSPEHLRKYALIKTGYCTKKQVVCASQPEALSLVALMREADEFCVIQPVDRVVTVWRAKSQKEKRGDNEGMSRAEFQESKDRVLHFVSNLIGTDAATLMKAAA